MIFKLLELATFGSCGPLLDMVVGPRVFFIYWPALASLNVYKVLARRLSHCEGPASHRRRSPRDAGSSRIVEFNNEVNGHIQYAETLQLDSVL